MARDTQGRLRRLEAVTTGGRCAVCRDWPSTPVVYVNDPPGRANRPDGPDVCPRCGWQVTVIRVEDVEEWRYLGAAGMSWRA